MEEEKKKNYFFCLYFQHSSMCFNSNFDQERSLDAELNYASSEYPLYILLTDLATPKTRNTWKKVMMMSSSCFFRYFFFLDSGFHQNYVKYIFIGCGIKFRIQRDLPIEIWVKTRGDMSKIKIKKVVFFLFFLQN